MVSRCFVYATTVYLNKFNGEGNTTYFSYSYWKVVALSCIDWTQALEWLKLFISPFGAILGAFLGAYLASRWTEKRRSRREHFVSLKNTIFGPWKTDLRLYTLEYPIHTSYGSPLVVRSFDFPIEDNILFEDVKNHFPEVSREWVKIKGRVTEYHKECSLFAQRIEKTLTEKTGLRMVIGFEDEKAFLHDYVRIIYNDLVDRAKTGSSRDRKFKITQPSQLHQLTCNGIMVARGTQEQMQTCEASFNEILKMPKNKRIASSQVKKVEIIRNDVKEFVRKLSQIIEETNLPKDCTYI